MSVIKIEEKKSHQRSKKMVGLEGTNYTITIDDEYSIPGYGMIFLPGVTVNAQDPFVTAWQASPYLQTEGENFLCQVSIQWGIGFTTAPIKPDTGVSLSVNYNMNASPGSAYLFSFENGGFKLTPNGAGTAGCITVTCDGSIPANAASICLSMNGSIAAAYPAAPNLVQTWAPNPKFSVNFGNYIEGAVYQLGEMINNSYDVNWPANDYDATVILNGSGIWTGHYKPQMLSKRFYKAVL
jgi:hypothetical protein